MKALVSMDSYFRARACGRPAVPDFSDVFSISGRGTVVTGGLSMASANIGDEIEIVGIKETMKTTAGR